MKSVFKILNEGKFVFIFLIASIAFVAVRCQKWVRPDNSPQISKHGGDDSVDADHMYNGYNCMNCHYTEGRGEGWFFVAGTINGNPGNGLVRLYKDFNQTPVATLEVDVHGNFYTTDEIDFSSGLFVDMVDASGQVKQMTGKISNGQCSLCHGVSTSSLNY